MRPKRESSQTKHSLNTDNSKRRDCRPSGEKQRLKPSLAPLLIGLTEFQFDVIEIEARQPDGGYDVKRSRRDERTGQRDAVGHHEEEEIALHVLIIQFEKG